MFFAKNDHVNLIQSPKILYNGDQKVKAYRAQQSFRDALGTGPGPQRHQALRPHHATHDPGFMFSDGKMSMLTQDAVQTRPTSLKTTLTEKEI